MEKYLDRNGKEIKVGSYIMHESGDVVKVELKDGKIGFLNEHTDEINPLTNFDLDEWMIVN